MDYLFENLGDERFQEFCSCLVSKEFQNIQTYPVGQPDGGRDSVVYNINSIKKEFIVFQVKFVRNPNQERDIVKWLADIIKGEARKIERLVRRGAKSYYLLTNVRGTGHLENGTKDKINKILEESLKIPAVCWWRDDLAVLFNKDPLFKWSFPELLNGQDILNSILFQNLQENKERRESVIRAYLTDQYEIDNQVKFKQIHLQNDLLDLFTDVPLRLRKFNERSSFLKEAFGMLNNSQRRHVSGEEPLFSEENANTGAAAFLLHERVQRELQRILLEGGPGQGKSTISQYVCQVHRARLLNKTCDINSLPQHIRKTPIRLPIKIDLRHIADWVDKKDPYQNSLNNEHSESVKSHSLEAFLIRHIYFHSKLEEFSTSDLIAIFKSSPILLIFDGFDEIANIKARTEVIEFINKGITRISANAKSIQVIITSRPAAFSDSVGFSIENYPHFELADIPASIAHEYVDKWIKSSKMDARDANELRKLVKDKLELPHLKDLAKSPMQLAILISLLRTKGQSLPNKRTALYDNYIELFFDRESEKNPLIRDKRLLIIEIHEYLAWLLHSEAELFKSNGSIGIEILTKRLKEYLSHEGHDPSIADQLFDVMKERVCALVSRVQGTFEFEVQPLREYFCAKYLYKSAPHSTAGSIRAGAKPDRLRAILRNFYWQNVVRFFSGCADAGELDMLIQELKDLQNDPILRNTSYPIHISTQLLSDYVFSQKPLKLKDVVKMIVDAINARRIISQSVGWLTSGERILLPVDCGRDEVVEECFLQLSKFPPNDYASELITIINNNPVEVLKRWSDLLPKFKNDLLTKWIQYGYRLHLIEHIEDRNLFELLKSNDNTARTKRIQVIVEGKGPGILDKDRKIKSFFLDGLLEGSIRIFLNEDTEHSVIALSILLQPYFLSIISKLENSAIPFINFMCHQRRGFGRVKDYHKLILNFPVNDNADEVISEYVTLIKPIINLDLSEFRSKIEPWEVLVENGRKCFGEKWMFEIIAAISAGIKSREETYDDCGDLNNNSLSLCRRARHARMKSGNTKYWEAQLEKSKNHKFILLVFFTWATPRVIMELLPQTSQLLAKLSPGEFSLLTQGLRITVNNSTFSAAQEKIVERELKGHRDDTIKFLLSFRFTDECGLKFIYNNINTNPSIIKDVEQLKLVHLVSSFLKKASKSKLKEIRGLYKDVAVHSDWNQYMFLPPSKDYKSPMPYSIAKMIMEGTYDYPQVIISHAEKVCKLYANNQSKAIGEIANAEKWFEAT